MESRSPKIVPTLPGKRAKEIIAKDRRYTSSSYIEEYPLVIERGEGAMVEDVDGNQFLDFMGGIAVNLAGYAHPRFLEAIRLQTDKFLHTCGSDFYYASFSNLAEKLAQMTPISGENNVFLTNSGTEAVEDGLMANPAQTGSYLIGKLHELKEQHPIIGDVRGIGLMVGVELSADDAGGPPPSRLAHEITAEAFSRGLLLLPCGESAIRFFPPLIVTEPDVDLALEIFAGVLRAYSRKKEAR